MGQMALHRRLAAPNAVFVLQRAKTQLETASNQAMRLSADVLGPRYTTKNITLPSTPAIDRTPMFSRPRHARRQFEAKYLLGCITRCAKIRQKGDSRGEANGEGLRTCGFVCSWVVGCPCGAVTFAQRPAVTA